MFLVVGKYEMLQFSRLCSWCSSSVKKTSYFLWKEGSLVPLKNVQQVHIGTAYPKASNTLYTTASILGKMLDLIINLCECCITQMYYSHGSLILVIHKHFSHLWHNFPLFAHYISKLQQRGASKHAGAPGPRGILMRRAPFSLRLSCIYWL